jgi:rhodanese-related sulfurtransferase
MKATELKELKPGKPVYVICQSGLRGYIACRILTGFGFDAYNFSSGYRFYEAVIHDRALIQQALAAVWTNLNLVSTSLNTKKKIGKLYSER